jgi:hypothetical protein
LRSKEKVIEMPERKSHVKANNEIIEKIIMAVEMKEKPQEETIEEEAIAEMTTEEEPSKIQGEKSHVMKEEKLRETPREKNEETPREKPREKNEETKGGRHVMAQEGTSEEETAVIVVIKKNGKKFHVMKEETPREKNEETKGGRATEIIEMIDEEKAKEETTEGMAQEIM